MTLALPATAPLGIWLLLGLGSNDVAGGLVVSDREGEVADGIALGD
jgi:hypothetical protein